MNFYLQRRIKSSLEHKRFAYIPLGWTLLITFLSLVSTNNFTNMPTLSIPFKDKGVHFIFYFGFSALWLLYFYSRKGIFWYVPIFILSVGYGLLMEACQYLFTNTRTADIWDIVANTTGAFAGCMSIALLSKIYTKRISLKP